MDTRERIIIIIIIITKSQNHKRIVEFEKIYKLNFSQQTFKILFIFLFNDIYNCITVAAT